MDSNYEIISLIYLIGVLILMQGNVLYAGVAFGFGAAKFLDAFK